MLDGMSDSIQRSRIENLHSREVDRQSPTGLIFRFSVTFCCLLSCPPDPHNIFHSQSPVTHKPSQACVNVNLSPGLSLAALWSTPHTIYIYDDPGADWVHNSFTLSVYVFLFHANYESEYRITNQKLVQPCYKSRQKVN